MNRFREDVYKGLEGKSKRLSSRYFYDDTGDQLFQQIMQLSEYYLPAAELEILKNYSFEIAEYLLRQASDFEIVELGAGDGSKTVLFLNQLKKSGLNFLYRPLDISGHILQKNREFICSAIPDLQIIPLRGDFFETLKQLERTKQSRLTMFMGSNIGNFEGEKATNFLKFISKESEERDLFLIAFDLKKDPNVILNAYNDKTGVTAKFNLNLLRRINRELGADFDTSAFYHYSTYNPVSGVASSYLISKNSQTVSFPDGRSFNFFIHEPIHTEVSCKFSKKGVEKLAESASLKVQKWWTDSRNYYGIALMKKVF